MKSIYNLKILQHHILKLILHSKMLSTNPGEKSDFIVNSFYGKNGLLLCMPFKRAVSSRTASSNFSMRVSSPPFAVADETATAEANEALSTPELREEVFQSRT
jgi:hypothetical protein